ncbi:hypothetical protein LEMLEM_LOCUS9792 [Lemmus lemmus]
MHPCHQLSIPERRTTGLHLYFVAQERRSRGANTLLVQRQAIRLFS